MPQASITYKEQISTVLPRAANSFAVAGVCSQGDPTRAYTFEPSQIGGVNDVIGDGVACEAAMTLLRYGKRTVTVFPVTPTVAGSISAVDKNGGSGPNVTVAAIAAAGDILINGPYDSLDIALKIVTGGAAGTARFRWCVDDQTVDGEHVGSFQGEVTVPAVSSAEIVGTVDLSTITLASLNGKTFVGQSNGPTTVVHTFTTPTSVADIAVQLNAAFATLDFDIVGANKLRIKSTTTGTSGTVAIGVGIGTSNAILGLTASAIVSSTPAVLTGSVNLTSLIGAYGGGGSLDGATFIVTSDLGPITTTFVAPADAAAVVSQINAAAGTDFVASLNGSNHLVLTSSTTSWLGSLLIGAGTANTSMGFAGGGQTDLGESVLTPSATGSAATYDIPGTGVRLTFAAGTYVADDVYTFSTKAPRIASGAVSALCMRVEAYISGGGLVGALWLTQEDPDTIESRTMLDAISARLTTARAAHFAYWALYQVTKDATDADVLLRCGTFEDQYVVPSAGDFYAAGGALPGSRFRRPWSWWCAWKAARDRYSSDLGNHADGPATSSNGFTAAGRDERTATTKLATFRTGQTGSGGGFLVAESTTFGEIYTYQGRTMAADGSIYGDLLCVRIALAVGRQMQRDLDAEINVDPLLKADGNLTDGEVDRIKNRLEAGVRTVLFEDPEVPDGHASAFAISDPVYTRSTKTLSASYEVQRRGIARAVTAELAITDTLSTTQGA